MEFKETLMQVADDFGMQLDDFCFAVSTRDFDFPFSFFAFENDEILGIFVTDDSGMERLHLIIKNEIVYLKIHYHDELEGLFEIDDNEHQVHRSYI